MAAVTRKVVGKGVALKRGHYPTPEGYIRTVAEGEEFDLLEGLEKSNWFVRKDDPKATAPKPVKSAEVPGAGPKPGSKAKTENMAGDIV